MLKNKEKRIGEILNELKNIALLTRKYITSVIIYTVMAVLSVVFGLLSTLVTQSLIDFVTKSNAHNNLLQFDSVKTAVAAVVAFSVFKIIFSATNSRVAEKMRIRINTEMTADTFDRFICSEWEYTSDFASGDILNRFNSDVSTVASSVIGIVPTAFTKVFQFGAAFCVILYYDPVMALISLVSVPLSLICSRFLVKQMHMYAKEIKKISSKMMTFNSDALLNMQYLKSFGLVTVFCSKLRKIQNEYISLSLDYNKFSIIVTSVISFVTQIVTYACFGWGVFRLWSGAISFGTLVLFIQLYSMLSGSFGALVGIVPTLINSVAASERITEIRNLPADESLDDANTSRFFENNRNSQLKLSLENVSFRYKEETENALTDVSFECRTGDFVALTGPSGEGKTTMLRLMLSLVHPTQGECRITDVDSGDYINIAPSTRKFFSYVPQKNTMFRDTLSANMRMVKQDATDEEIISALKAACAYDFVMKEKDGINCMVGDGGTGFSEGQFQRLSIARALLRNAPIILLDEATSALDIDTEQQVLKNLSEWGENKICIFTTHRPSVFEVCNKAYLVTDSECVSVM